MYNLLKYSFPTFISSCGVQAKTATEPQCQRGKTRIVQRTSCRKGAGYGHNRHASANVKTQGKRDRQSDSTKSLLVRLDTVAPLAPVVDIVVVDLGTADGLLEHTGRHLGRVGGIASVQALLMSSGRGVSGSEQAPLSARLRFEAESPPPSPLGAMEREGFELLTY